MVSPGATRGYDLRGGGCNGGGIGSTKKKGSRGA